MWTSPEYIPEDLNLDKLSLSDSSKKGMSRCRLPSHVYLAKTTTLSTRLPIPESCRKLIILDLNGTLLFRRKAKSRASKPAFSRPYIPVFRSFLFHDTVKPWLDVMVWSSAQPHNVQKMVLGCFEEDSPSLKAVWARDTLGLSRGDYRNKAETVKDLEKPWAKFEHSLETTALLDDSVSKAQLQPYNHICVPTYTGELRFKDRTVSSKNPSGKSEKTGEYDKTLLAIIGILDEMKSQSNVASWIRAGGLWAGHGRPLSEKDEVASAIISDQSSHSVNVPEMQDPAVPNGLLWFEHQPCLLYWVERGISVAANLNIELEPGKHLR